MGYDVEFYVLKVGCNAGEEVTCILSHHESEEEAKDDVRERLKANGREVPKNEDELWYVEDGVCQGVSLKITTY